MNKLQELYERMWTIDAYRRNSPGRAVLPNFLSIANPQPTDSILDIGCGTGKASAELHRLGFQNLTLLDFAENCLDDDVKTLNLPFIQHDITQPFPISARFGYCTDVMEHLDPTQVRDSLIQMKRAVEFLYLRISIRPDTMGRLIGETLHLTVEPFDWWLNTLTNLSFTIIHKVENNRDSVTFYLE